MAELRNRPTKLQAHDFYVSTKVDWDWLQEVKLGEALDQYLTRVFVEDEVRITCTAWRHLFRLRELVYKELCIEFLATFQFRKRSIIYDSGNFTFYLGCEKRECRVVELFFRFDLYNQTEVMNGGFEVFLDHFHKTLLDGVNEANWCSTIANGVYI